eukprot:UC4_evm4s1556
MPGRSQAALARRAAKRGRTIDEQNEADRKDEKLKAERFFARKRLRAQETQENETQPSNETTLSSAPRHSDKFRSIRKPPANKRGKSSGTPKGGLTTKKAMAAKLPNLIWPKQASRETMERNEFLRNADLSTLTGADLERAKVLKARAERKKKKKELKHRADR